MQVAKAPKNVKTNSGVVVDGEVGCEVKFARCCNPLPGDPIIGFITQGHGISIHKRDCPNVIQGMHNPTMPTAGYLPTGKRARARRARAFTRLRCRYTHTTP